MQFQSAHGARSHEPPGFLDPRLAAMRIDAAERQRDIGVVERDLRHVVVRRVRTASERLLDGEDDAADLARAVVLGLRRPVAGRPAGLEMPGRRLLGLRQRLLVFEVDVRVERYQLTDVDPRSGHDGAPMMTCEPGASAYNSSTSCARRASTARWLIDPLSVTS